MYLLAFHAFLRVGEITGRLPPQENCMTANNLNFICDDCNNPHSIEIKLDQYKHSSASNIPTLLIQTNTNIELCPVKAVWEYWQIRKHTKKNKMTNNDLLNTTQKTKEWATQTLLKTDELRCYGIVARRVLHVEQELLSLPEHLTSPPFSSWVCVDSKCSVRSPAVS